MSLLGKLAPRCVLHVAELVISPAAVQRRVRERRVCHQCEQDPIHDPRLPAEASPADPRRCAHCHSILHPRRGDAPRLLAARTQRYAGAATGIRAAFAQAGIEVIQLSSDHPPAQTASELSQLLAPRSTPL